MLDAICIGAVVQYRIMQVLQGWLAGAYLVCRIVRLSSVKILDTVCCLWVDSSAHSQVACQDLHAHTVSSDATATAGLVVDASNGFKWPEDVTFITAMLSTILGDTANIQIVTLLPEASTLPSGPWTVDTPPRMTR